MTFLHGTNVYAWKERLFGKPAYKPSRLSIYENGRLLWESEESGKHKGCAQLKDIFSYIRIGVLNSEVKRDRARDNGLILAYHTLILPLEMTKPTVPAGMHECEFSVGFEREIFDWMQAFAKVTGTSEKFHDLVRKYRLRKKYNIYGGSTHHGLAELGDAVDAKNGDAEDDDDPAHLWSACHGANEDYVAIWSAFQEMVKDDVAANAANQRGYSCVKCWQG